MRRRECRFNGQKPVATRPPLERGQRLKGGFQRRVGILTLEST